ncbi:hypothetical protein BH23BAC4_BH23BAC4_09760 [soil metagenome]
MPRGAVMQDPSTLRCKLLLRKCAPDLHDDPMRSSRSLIPKTPFSTYLTMLDAERSAYPHPGDFKVMRPEYIEDEESDEIQAVITIPPFKVVGRSVTRAAARRAALYEAAKTYRSYHPSFRIESPFPNEFVDKDGTKWTRIPERQRAKLGDYEFADTEGEDYADIEQMLLWDVRPVESDGEGEDED